MKTINKIAVLLFICIQLCSCNNEDDELQNQANLSLLINNWHTISQRIVLADGSNYILLCDTEKFKNDSKWVLAYTGISGNKIEDSAKYELQDDNKTLKFYGYVNGVLETNAEIAKIKVLNEHLLVYHYLRANGTTMIIDSLGR